MAFPAQAIGSPRRRSADKDDRRSPVWLLASRARRGQTSPARQPTMAGRGNHQRPAIPGWNPSAASRRHGLETRAGGPSEPRPRLEVPRSYRSRDDRRDAHVAPGEGRAAGLARSDPLVDGLLAAELRVAGQPGAGLQSSCELVAEGGVARCAESDVVPAAGVAG